MSQKAENKSGQLQSNRSIFFPGEWQLVVRYILFFSEANCKASAKILAQSNTTVTQRREKRHCSS